MRRLFFLFLIVLLPLRGWAGEFMAVEMATSALSTATTGAMPPGCTMHLQESAATDDAGQPSESAMPACGSCDLCLPIVEAAVPPVCEAAFAGHVKRAAPGASILSVAHAPSVKPPIS